MVILALAVLVPVQSPAVGATKKPVAVGIAEREHYISPYRRSVPVGLVKFNIRNFGEDTHNLVISGPRKFLLVGPDVEPGSGASWTVRFRRAGTYKLLCTRANHLRLGMKSKLRVKKRR
jgi:plastocyanin